MNHKVVGDKIVGDKNKAKNSSNTSSPKAPKSNSRKKKPILYKVKVIMSNGESFETYSTAGKKGEIIVWHASWDKHNHKAWQGIANSGNANNDSSFSKRYGTFSLDNIVKKNKNDADTSSNDGKTDADTSSNDSSS